MTNARAIITPEQKQRAAHWAAERLDWFKANPDREFQKQLLSDSDLKAISLSGLVVATSETPALPPSTLVAVPVHGEQMAIIRRLDVMPGIAVLLEPAPPSRLLPPPQLEEKVLRGIWIFAELAAHGGLSSRDLAASIPQIRNRKLPTLH